MPALSEPAAPRFEGIRSSYELVQRDAVIYGRLSVFFAAKDSRTDQQVLVKSFLQGLDQQPALATFYREIEALMRLKHPNILELLDYSPGSGPQAPPFVVVPWCKGGNLNELRRQADFLPPERVVPILREVAAAIDYAHGQGIIHGDIKPENILLSGDRSHVFLGDFGMAKYFDVTDQVRRSMEAPTRGTSAYLSPEQLRDNHQSPRSDIYSFGLVAFELLTGRLPFDIKAPLYQQLHARVGGNLIPATEANPALSKVVQDALASALATHPADRPESAMAFCEMLVGARAAPAPRSAKAGRRSLAQWWNDLESAGKTAVVIAVIGGLVGVITAIVQIIPSLLGKN